MKKKITATHLAEAATRHFHGETLSDIAADLGISENSLISAKNRRAGEWRQAIEAARRAIAAAPIAALESEVEALKSENAELKNRNATLEAESDSMRTELQAIKIENKEIRTRSRERALYHHFRRNN